MMQVEQTKQTHVLLNSVNKNHAVLVCACPVAPYVFILAFSCLPPTSAQPILGHVTVSFNCPGAY